MRADQQDDGRERSVPDGAGTDHRSSVHTPKRGPRSLLYVTDGWAGRGTFAPEEHPIHPPESSWINVQEVRPRPGTKPFTLYSYRLAPYPTFLVNGHLVREPW